MNKKSSSNRIIFVDFNGVISYKNFWYTLEKNDKTAYDNINQTLFVSNFELVKSWMLGKNTSQEICEYLSLKLSLDCDYIYNSLVESCKKIDLSINIKNALQRLKELYKIILVTDNMDCFSDFIVKYNSDYFQIFDDIFNSSESGYFKNEVYFKFIEKYNAKINLSYLVDDSIKNCEIFNNLWWKAFNVKWETEVLQVLKWI